MSTLNIKKDVLFKELTTFKVGGRASYFVGVGDKKELLEAVDFAKKKNLPIFVIGGGSDILVSDEDFEGVVVKCVGQKVSFKDKNGHVLVKSQSGLEWDKLVEICVLRNLQGIECLSGIPGNVGATPIQNIGAYGQELKDVFVSLSAHDIKENKFVQLEKAKCDFSYRESIFKRKENKDRFIITAITLELSKNKKPTIAYASLENYLNEKKIKNPSLLEVRKAVLHLRGQKLDNPKLIGNAGSFFKNPIIKKEVLENIKRIYPETPSYETQNGEVKLFAGWLIEKAGWKGKNYKNAKVSEKSALVITNPEGKATAKDIMELADLISSDVYKIFGIKLEPEVQFIGFN